MTFLVSAKKTPFPAKKAMQIAHCTGTRHHIPRRIAQTGGLSRACPGAPP